MSYKQPPPHSIEHLGGLERYVNNFFARRNLPYNYQKDVVPLFELRGMSAGTKARTLGIVRSTFENWEKLYRATNT